MLLTSDNKSDQPSGWRCHSIIHDALVSTSLGQFGMIRRRPVDPFDIFSMSSRLWSSSSSPLWHKIQEMAPKFVAPLSPKLCPSCSFFLLDRITLQRSSEEKIPLSVYPFNQSSIHLSMYPIIHSWPIHSSTNPENYSPIHLSNHSCLEPSISPSI